MDKNQITIGFTLKDRNGNEFSHTSTTEVFNSLGENELDVIGRQFGLFLKKCGYARENDYIFMEDITEAEYDYLLNCLSESRNLLNVRPKDENI